MSTQILTTKLYIPTSRHKLVLRARLVKLLNKGLHRQLTLISAPAGFGKTTLVSDWITHYERPIAWLSLDVGDNDSTRFLLYVIVAMQTIDSSIGEGVLTVLQSPQPPPIESLLTILLNEISAISENFVLVLDDYHVIDSPQVDTMLTFLLEHMPSQMHMVITTREDPQLPIARLRARGQLTELRAADLRFTTNEATEFLSQTMGLELSRDDINALEMRTEGWITGLQLAAISMQGHQDTTSFIQSFSGSHHFVLDYLLEEVLHQQSERIQAFLLRTSILDRVCGSLCDAVMLDPEVPGQEILEYLARTNLFLIPLDNERHWYRYHQLFADLLRQRLHHSTGLSTEEVKVLHTRASQWYEDEGFEIDAFHHAIAANDVVRAEGLIDGNGAPLYFRGIVKPILNWLESLPHNILDSRPSLWVTYASTLLLSGQHTAVEQKLHAAEHALKNTRWNNNMQDIIGRIASMRATLAVIENDVKTIITQSNYALEHLHPENLAVRIATYWTLGYAYQLQGNHHLARDAYNDVIQLGQSSDNSFYIIAATISLGQLQELDNQLHQASKSYHSAIQLSGEPTHPIVSQAFLGLARIHYQWNDLDAVQKYGRQCNNLLQQMQGTDTTASYMVLLSYLHLAQGDLTSSSKVLDEAEVFIRQHNFMFRMSDIVMAQVNVLLHQGNLKTAMQLAETHELSISQARVYLAQGDPSTALTLLEPLRKQAMATDFQNELLKVMVLQAIVYHALGEEDNALKVLGDSLALAKSGGFIRIFVDEGLSMAQLLQTANNKGLRQDYVSQLLSAFPTPIAEQSTNSHTSQLIDPLSGREIEVLQLIARGLTNQEIADHLYLSLHTVKVHARNIYSKLAVKNRTQAVAQAKALGILTEG